MHPTNFSMYKSNSMEGKYTFQLMVLKQLVIGQKNQPRCLNLTVYTKKNNSNG